MWDCRDTKQKFKKQVSVPEIYLRALWEVFRKPMSLIPLDIFSIQILFSILPYKSLQSQTLLWFSICQFVKVIEEKYIFMSR